MRWDFVFKLIRGGYRKPTIIAEVRAHSRQWGHSHPPTARPLMSSPPRAPRCARQAPPIKNTIPNAPTSGHLALHADQQ